MCFKSGARCAIQDAPPIRLVGYTVEYVEKLRAERDADAAARDNAQGILVRNLGLRLPVGLECE